MVKTAKNSEAILPFFAPDGKIDTVLQWTGITWLLQQPSSNLGQL